MKEESTELKEDIKTIIKKEKNVNIKNIISIIIAIFSAFILNLQFNKETNWIGFELQGNFSIFVLGLIVGIYFLVNYSIKIKDKRLTICSIILGVVFAITYFIGYLGNTYLTTTVPISKKFILYMVLKISDYFLIFSATIKALIFKLDDIRKKNLDKNEKEYNFFTNNKKSLFVIAIVFFISYIPYILYYYPGTIFYDNIQCLMEITGKEQYSNFQPILYTAIYGGLWNLGKLVFGSGNAGILLYTLLQVAYTSSTFSIVLYYMAKRNISFKWRIITFLLLIFNPIIGMLAVRGEKGMFFHLSLILVVIGIIDVLYEKEKFFKKKWKPVVFVILVLFMTLMRNNGLYILILTIPFVLIYFRKNRKLLVYSVIVLIIPVIMLLIIKGPVFKILGVEQTLDREMFSIPSQQIGRIMKYGKDNLTEEEKEEINQYINIADYDLGEIYMPELSDNTKAMIRNDAIKDGKIGFIKLYFKLAFKYPIQTIMAFIDNTYSYYAPNGTNIGGVRNYNQETEDVLRNFVIECNPGKISNYQEYDYYPQHIVNFKIIDEINTEFSYKRVPIFSMLFTGIGFYFWILLFLITYSIYTKNYKNICMYMPIFILWLTTIAGPVNDIRYIYSIILIMPLYIGFTFFRTKSNNDTENKVEKV